MLGRGRLADDQQVGFGPDDRHEALPDDLVVVEDEDADGVGHGRGLAHVPVGRTVTTLASLQAGGVDAVPDDAADQRGHPE